MATNKASELTMQRNLNKAQNSLANARTSASLMARPGGLTQEQWAAEAARFNQIAFNLRRAAASLEVK